MHSKEVILQVPLLLLKKLQHHYSMCQIKHYVLSGRYIAQNL